jgi:putative ABC transport system substrate-binding protein
VRLQLIEVHNVEQFDGAFATMASERVEALLMFPGSTFFNARRRIVELAVAHRLPSITLPVKQSTRFALVINLKAAKELGIDMPLSLMIRADEIIE